MKIINLLILFGLYSEFVHAQVLVEQWDKRYGGDDSENFSDFIQTHDSGFILAGTSSSGANGDRTQPNWNTNPNFSTDDYWIVKTDLNGSKTWDARFGGNYIENLYVVLQADDHGYLLGGESFSVPSGDRTQAKLGIGDGWLVKTDSTGNLQWEKRYGGNASDRIVNIVKAHDGGYLLGCVSYSNASGERTQNNWDPSLNTPDFWIVKIDPIGNIEWDTRYGGNNQEILSQIIPTADSGYILAGESWSDISGDKTQNSRGSLDYWLVKIDVQGSKMWDKRYGVANGAELYSMTGSNEKGFLLCGHAGYGISQDKSMEEQGYWLFKIDSAGNKEWDRLIPEAHYGRNSNGIKQTRDGGYLLATTSSSNSGGNKSEDNLGAQQTWILKMDAQGNRQWDKTMLTNEEDIVGYALELESDCYLFGNYTFAGIGGNKSEESRGGNDYWVAKFCEGPVGISEISNKVQIQVYPNPTADDISISIQQINLQSATFTITNAIGQVLYHRQEKSLADSYTKMLDLRNLPAGSYFVIIETNDERIVKQVVKQ